MRRLRASLLLKIVISGALVAYLVIAIDFRHVGASLARANPTYFLASLGTALIARWLVSWQTAVAMRSHGQAYPTAAMFSITMRALFYSFFLPGDVAGAAVKYHKIAKLHKQRAQTVATIIYLRLVNLVILLGIALAAMVVHWPFSSNVPVWSAAALFCIFALLLAYIHFRPRHHNVENRAFLRVLNIMPMWARSRTVKLINSFTAFHKLPANAVVNIWLSGLLYKFFSSVAFWLAALALKVPVSLLAMLWIQSVVELIQMLPLTLFNFGTREVSLVFILGLFHVAAAEALAISLLLYSQRLVQVAWGGLLELKDYLGISKARDRSGSAGPFFDQNSKHL